MNPDSGLYLDLNTTDRDGVSHMLKPQILIQRNKIRDQVYLRVQAQVMSFRIIHKQTQKCGNTRQRREHKGAGRNAGPGQNDGSAGRPLACARGSVRARD
jgi:hypothetical protein